MRTNHHEEKKNNKKLNKQEVKIRIKKESASLCPQSEEIRRTLGDRKPDSGAVIHSLKQKILKLEVQLRDKESAYK